MIQRTWWPRLNRNAQLAKRLVFAGLGGGASTLQYADASGYGNHGTLMRMDPATDWVFDPTLGRWCTDLDGVHDSTGDYIECPVETASTNFCTFTIWINPRDVAEVDAIFFSRANKMGLMVSRGTGTPLTYFWAGVPDEYNANTGLTFALNAWNLCAVTITPTAATVYRWNDVSGLGSWTNTKTHSAKAINGLSIARDSNWEDRKFNGLASDAMVWDRAISPAEISKLADPSNTMLSGLIMPPRRMVWPVAVAGPSIPEGSANLSAIASIAATGYTAHSGSATLTAQAAIAAVGYRESAGTATLSAVAGMEAVGYIEHCGTATLVAAAGIEAVGHATHYGDATLSAIADLTAIGYVTHAGHAVLSAIADITATGESPTLVPEGSAVLSAVASIDAVGYAAARGEATLQAVASIAATGYAEASGHAVLSAIADMAAVGEAPVVDVPQGYAVLDAVADMAAEGYAEHAGYAVLSSVAGITAVGVSTIPVDSWIVEDLQAHVPGIIVGQAHISGAEELDGHGQ